MLLPPKPGVCPECAINHPPGDPHNRQSLYYQYSFYAKQGHWPSWKDAMAHCDDGTKKKWSEELINQGQILE